MKAGSDLLRSRSEKERAILVGVHLPRQSREECEGHLEELALLTVTAGGEVVGTVLQHRRVLDPAYLIGRGKAEEVAALSRSQRADLIIFDEDLTAAQARNLEQLIAAKVIDRSALILDIFARRARTREARTQVELAQLRYLLPRLTRRWTHLSRQVGGIGVRGVGETQLEIDRRIIRKKIARLSSGLQSIEKTRKVGRQARSSAFRVALGGYTNAGKSTIINALTQSTARVENRLFATLDPMTRRYRTRQGRDIVLTDTVGFIRKLPHQLVASFRSTLLEVMEADLLLEIVDLSYPEYEQQRDVTRNVLADLGVHDQERLTVYNKIDALAEGAVLQRARRLEPQAIFVSARMEFHMDDLRKRIEEMVQDDTVERWVNVPPGASRFLSRVHTLAEVVETTCENGTMAIQFRASRRNADRLMQLLGKERPWVGN